MLLLVLKAAAKIGKRLKYWIADCRNVYLFYCIVLVFSILFHIPPTNP